MFYTISVRKIQRKMALLANLCISIGCKAKFENMVF